MKINTNLDKGKWITWKDDVEFLIRPYPVSHIKADVSDTELGLLLFKYCVIGWKGLINEDTDKPIPFNDKMKLYLYDHFPDMTTFIIDIITKIMRMDDLEVKNS